MAVTLERGNQNKITVIPAWMPESSHKDVSLGAGNLPESSTCASGKLPSMALDSGIHAGMTVFSRSVGLVYNDDISGLGTRNWKLQLPDPQQARAC